MRALLPFPVSDGSRDPGSLCCGRPFSPDDAGVPADPIYPHPLAFLLGVEGVALMRAFAGEYDEAFTSDRIAEVRALSSTTPSRWSRTRPTVASATSRPGATASASTSGRRSPTGARPALERPLGTCMDDDWEPPE